MSGVVVFYCHLGSESWAALGSVGAVVDPNALVCGEKV